MTAAPFRHTCRVPQLRSFLWPLSGLLVGCAVVLSYGLAGHFRAPAVVDAAKVPDVAAASKATDMANWLPIPSVAVEGRLPNSRWDRTPTFSVEQCAVPVADILDMPPGADDIPPIDAPRFVDAEAATWVSPMDEVLGISTGRRSSRCYPLSVLRWHGVVNDTIDGRSIAILYDALSGAAMAFYRRHNGRPLEFSLSGKAYKGCALLFDRTDKGLWYPVRGECISGPLMGKATLEPIEMTRTTWARWSHRHRHTQILSRNTGHGRPYATDPYASPEAIALRQILTEAAGVDLRGIGANALVLGVRIGEDTVAFIPPTTPPSRPLRQNVQVGGRRMRVTYDARTTNLAFSASFAPGPSARQFTCYWYAWCGAYPQTRVERLGR